MKIIILKISQKIYVQYFISVKTLKTILKLNKNITTAAF